MKKLMLVVMGLMVLASCSNDDEDVYDEVLSNTTWHQFYVIPDSEVVEETYTIPEDILSRLESTKRTEEAKDTIGDIQQTNEYVLTFGNNETCELNDRRNNLLSQPNIPGGCRRRIYNGNHRVERQYYIAKPERRGAGKAEHDVLRKEQRDKA